MNGCWMMQIRALFKHCRRLLHVCVCECVCLNFMIICTFSSLSPAFVPRHVYIESLVCLFIYSLYILVFKQTNFHIMMRTFAFESLQCAIVCHSDVKCFEFSFEDFEQKIEICECFCVCVSDCHPNNLSFFLFQRIQEKNKLYYCGFVVCPFIQNLVY